MSYYHDIRSIQNDLDYAQTVADLMAVKARLDALIDTYISVTTHKPEDSYIDLLDEALEQTIIEAEK